DRPEPEDERDARSHGTGDLQGLVRGFRSDAGKDGRPRTLPCPRPLGTLSRSHRGRNRLATRMVARAFFETNRVQPDRNSAKENPGAVLGYGFPSDVGIGC